MLEALSVSWGDCTTAKCDGLEHAASAWKLEGGLHEERAQLGSVRGWG